MDKSKDTEIIEDLPQEISEEEIEYAKKIFKSKGIVPYPHIENHQSITKHFNGCVTDFHDDYITDVVIQKDYVQLKIAASGSDTKDWKNIKPCTVCIECYDVKDMSGIDPELFKVYPLYELKTVKKGNLYKLILDGCNGVICCKRIIASVEED